MADYFVSFSCILDVGSAENAARADGIRGELAAELERDEGMSLGFEMAENRERRPGKLWIFSDDRGEPGDVVQFVLRCAEAFDLQGLWGFCWGLTCSRPRLDGFGGGAQLIDLGQRKSVDWIDCDTWLAEKLAAPAGAAVATGEGTATPAPTNSAFDIDVLVQSDGTIVGLAAS